MFLIYWKQKHQRLSQAISQLTLYKYSLLLGLQDRITDGGIKSNDFSFSWKFALWNIRIVLAIILYKRTISCLWSMCDWTFALPCQLAIPSLEKVSKVSIRPKFEGAPSDTRTNVGVKWLDLGHCVHQHQLIICLFWPRRAPAGSIFVTFLSKYIHIM